VTRFFHAACLLATMSFAAAATEAQQPSSTEQAYFRAVARYFQISESELVILRNWDVPAEEIPVVLFVARRAGISSEALVALRQSGRSWTDLSERYQIGARALHVPIHDPAATGRLGPLYVRFQETPVERWGSIPLTSDDIVALVNVRVLSQSLGLPPDEIMRRTANATSFVDLYAQLIR